MLNKMESGNYLNDKGLDVDERCKYCSIAGESIDNGYQKSDYYDDYSDSDDDKVGDSDMDSIESCEFRVSRI